jgi:hypothetical protein
MGLELLQVIALERREPSAPRAAMDLVGIEQASAVTRLVPTVPVTGRYLAAIPRFASTARVTPRNCSLLGKARPRVAVGVIAVGARVLERSGLRLLRRKFETVVSERSHCQSHSNKRLSQVRRPFFRFR